MGDRGQVGVGIDINIGNDRFGENHCHHDHDHGDIIIDLGIFKKH